MPIIKPTIGRVVLFVPKETNYSFGFCLIAGQPCAALVTNVHSDTMVNLSVFDLNGRQFPRCSVTLRQTDAPTPPGDYCEWMPYQIGQAAKTEELEKKLADK